jgi:hypothetical protein
MLSILKCCQFCGRLVMNSKAKMLVVIDQDSTSSLSAAAHARYRVRRRDFEDLLTCALYKPAPLLYPGMSKAISNCTWMGNVNSKITTKKILNKYHVFFAKTSVGCYALSIILSRQPRRPYNQWQKCTDFLRSINEEARSRSLDSTTIVQASYLVGTLLV